MSVQKIEETHQPVVLLLIDINMPILNGMETVPKIKKLFTEFNNFMREGPSVSGRKNLVVRPPILYFSQFDRKTMYNFISKEENADFYLEKPVQD